MTGTLASGTISRRGALKLIGGAALGMLVLPVFPSTASAAGKLQPVLKSSSLGKFGGVKYVQHDGLFVGTTSTGNYSVPYRISAPANPRRAIRSTVLVEPPHFATGTYLRDGWLGRPFLFGRGFLHASVGYSTTTSGPFVFRILDPAAQGVFIDGGVVDGNGRTDDEIVVDFARALRSDPVARALMGPAARRYLAGFSDSADPVKRIVTAGLAEDVFDLVVPITTGSEDDPQASIAAGKYSGKVLTVDSEFEWFYGRALEDRGTTPDHYRFFIVPGTPHVPDPLCPGFFSNNSTPASWQPALRAHFLQGHAWVTQGEAPPTSTRLATADGEISRDSNGNALLIEITGASAPRLPYVELGEARFITGFVGTFESQPPPTIEQLAFSSFDEYLAAFEEALDAQLQARYMLEEDAKTLLKRAGLSADQNPPGTFTDNYFRRYYEFRSGVCCP
ncbi:MAG TPA: alpha/beta hydrolase domain-containing protein [Rubrobacter sp.]|nr:alpha/beta hydrolase domain-containing protein [Rubrobacter sp.]